MDVPCGLKSLSTLLILFVFISLMQGSVLADMDTDDENSESDDGAEPVTDDSGSVLGYKPAIDKDDIEPVNARSGQSFKVIVTFSGQPDPTATWSHDTKSINKINGIHIKTKSGKATLSSEAATADQAGVYRLKVSNKFGSDEAVVFVKVKSKSKKVRSDGKKATSSDKKKASSDKTTKAPPTERPAFDISKFCVDGKLKITKGQSFRLEARIDRSRMSEVTWYLNGTEIRGGNHFFPNSSGLHVRHSRLTDSGTYWLKLVPNKGKSHQVTCPVEVTCDRMAPPRDIWVRQTRETCVRIAWRCSEDAHSRAEAVVYEVETWLTRKQRWTKIVSVEDSQVDVCNLKQKVYQFRVHTTTRDGCHSEPARSYGVTLVPTQTTTKSPIITRTTRSSKRSFEKDSSKKSGTKRSRKDSEDEDLETTTKEANREDDEVVQESENYPNKDQVSKEDSKKESNKKETKRKSQKEDTKEKSRKYTDDSESSRSKQSKESPDSKKTEDIVEPKGSKEESKRKVRATEGPRKEAGERRNDKKSGAPSKEKKALSGERKAPFSDKKTPSSEKGSKERKEGSRDQTKSRDQSRPRNSLTGWPEAEKSRNRQRASKATSLGAAEAMIRGSRAQAGAETGKLKESDKAVMKGANRDGDDFSPVGGMEGDFSSEFGGGLFGEGQSVSKKNSPAQSMKNAALKKQGMKNSPKSAKSSPLQEKMAQKKKVRDKLMGEKEKQKRRQKAMIARQKRRRGRKDEDEEEEDAEESRERKSAPSRDSAPKSRDRSQEDQDGTTAFQDSTDDYSDDIKDANKNLQQMTGVKDMVVDF